jgi:ADP-ribosylation factor-like protein 2
LRLSRQRSQIKQKEKEVRILILGLDNAGKTTVLKRYCGENISTVEPTLGFNIQTVHHAAGYTLNMWDVGGQKSIRAYWRNYFESTDGIIWVVDSADTIRLDVCRAELRNLLQQERLAGASLLVLANKQDVVGALSPRDIEAFLELRGHDSFKNRHWTIQPCSAVTGDGLQEGIDWIVGDIGSRIFMLA